MAEWETTTVAPSVSVEEYHWGRIFYGTEAALVAAGLVQSVQLPGKRGQNKWSVTDVFEDGSSINIRRTRKDWYEVSKRYSMAEAKAKNNEIEIREARERESKAIAALPANAADYRAQKTLSFLTLLSMFRDVIKAQSGGYAFGPEFTEEFDGAAAEILAVIETSPVRFRRIDRELQISKIKHETVKADPKFATFMEGMLTPAGGEKLVDQQGDAA